MKIKLHYNAPFVLSYTFVAAIVLGIAYMAPGFMSYFTVGGSMNFTNPADYFRLFSHALGHANWAHYMGNFSLILILGPMLEEKYGTKDIMIMSFITALSTGILNVMFFSSGLLGASGIVFMMILLASFGAKKTGVIPLTFLLVVIVYLGGQVYQAFQYDNISQFAHIMGGVCGSIFGFMKKS